MIYRLCNPLKSNSFFIFGSRGTGKSTFIKHFLPLRSLYLDLLDDDVYVRLLQDNKWLELLCDEKKYEWIILDEIQKLPRLLNLVHRMIEKTNQKFAMTGSSSRKLKRGGANLLAGRAFVNVMHPFTSLELSKRFDLLDALNYGTLPKIHVLETHEQKKSYLKSYCQTYIKEEIQIEQTIRKLEPFRMFLEIAAFSSADIINYSKIAKQVGVQNHTVQSYFEILEDSYLGFFLPSFHRSIRKNQLSNPKFYFFDHGFKRALEGSLDSQIIPSTSYFGVLFESFVIQEIHRLNEYHQKDFHLSFMQTKHGFKIDLILSKGQSHYLIEIKSTKTIDTQEVMKLSNFSFEFNQLKKAFYLSQDEHELQIKNVSCIHWKTFLINFIDL